MLGKKGHNLRVQGSYDLYIVSLGGDEFCIVVDTHGEPLDHGKLDRDFRALEFSMGQPCSLNYLVAVDIDHKVAGAAGLDFGGREPKHAQARCPVAGSKELHIHEGQPVEEDKWIPVLCWLVANKIDADGKDSPLFLATAAYLDSLTGHIHANYLLAQVALEAFCSAVVEQETGVLVRDSKAWIRFVKERKHLILEHAVDDEAGRKLVNKVISSQQAPSTDRVEAALEHWRLEVPEVAHAEVKKRSYSAHRFLMAKESDADWQELADRLAIIQTLLVAVVAKYVGYKGPIVDWKWKTGRRAIPGWWAYEPIEEARRRFVVGDDELLGGAPKVG